MIQLGSLPEAYAVVLSDQEAAAKAQGFVKNMQQNLQYLRHQWERNGQTINKRWVKQSRDKKQAFLLALQPDMYPKQWSEVHFVRDYFPNFAKDDADMQSLGLKVHPHRNACLLPYMNLESLISVIHC